MEQLSLNWNALFASHEKYMQLSIGIVGFTWWGWPLTPKSCRVEEVWTPQVSSVLLVCNLSQLCSVVPCAFCTCNAGGLGLIPGQGTRTHMWQLRPGIWTSLVAQTVRKPACNAGDPGSIPGSGRSPGEGHGIPLQYSCLGHSMAEGLEGYSPGGSQRIIHDWVTNTHTRPSAARTTITKCRYLSPIFPALEIPEIPHEGKTLCNNPFHTVIGPGGSTGRYLCQGKTLWWLAVCKVFLLIEVHVLVLIFNWGHAQRTDKAGVSCWRELSKGRR